MKRLLFKINCLLSQAEFYETLWQKNHKIFVCSSLRKFSHPKPPGIWCPEFRKFAQKFLKRAQTQILWKVTITEKCHLLPAVNFICSVHDEATSRTVNERNNAVKCWMLNVRHNKYIPLHVHFLTPYGTSVLCPAVLHTYFLSGKSSASAEPNHHQLR